MNYIDAQVDSYERTFSSLMLAAETVAHSCEAVSLEPLTLLRAIAHQESRCGLYIDRARFYADGAIQIAARREPSFGPKGKYYMPHLSMKWGADAESSWGPLQIMYANAVRMGFPIGTDPSDVDNGLANTLVCVRATIPFLQFQLARLRQFGLGNSRSNLDEFADGWNSGNFRDKFIPKEYIDAVNGHYKTHRDMAICPSFALLRRA